MHKVVTIVGARPQFVKAAAMSRAFARHNGRRRSEERLEDVIVHTGQHYDGNMSQVFFDELEIPRPAHNLGIGSDLHGAQTGRMLTEIERVLLAEKPGLVVTYGDTNSTLAGALAAVKLHIPTAHIEAGLRSFNRRMPEEINRIVADEVSHLLFCPTETAVANLVAEGIPSGAARERPGQALNGQRVYRVGDVMCDSVLFYRQLAEERSDALRRFALSPRGYSLATLHRAENTDDTERLGEILTALADISADQASVVLPLHPRTRSLLQRDELRPLRDRALECGVRFVDPVGYLDMIDLERNARAVLTDSGGVQKEAYLLGTPCITLRDETEWVETVQAGWNVIVGASRDRILAAHETLSRWDGSAAPFSAGTPPGAVSEGLYGDGHAAEKIVHILAQFLEKNP